MVPVPLFESSVGPALIHSRLKLCFQSYGELAMRPTTMTITRHGDRFRIVFENGRYSTELDVGRAQLQRWSAEMVKRASEPAKSREA